ncbi:MAG: spermidine/putrescine ABC transporter ATP-binding protein [Verrucomicrobia bacterium GWF2_51_19]|nr:MAG: spermidine/putrescine ABC transporter ATP-binding protein [Verrucomicrobia bacterium GWF2_51_19]HCJ12312.1 spermidine/putrescine ABC transporter ATP-binding protein [Opitutae bacterium]
MIGIRVENLLKKFGTTVALDSVNLSIQAGELFFLLGPSGCGKTTLLRLLAGFYTPDEGAVFFGKDNVSKIPPYKRNTGMVFQSYALWPHMTVYQNVAFGLEQKKISRNEIKERVEAALASVQMEPYAQRKPNQLSGGQQQRVALARALVVRPQCLLLDEPLSNLDAKLRNEMRSEIRRICKEFELTTIYVTHDQEEALSIADRIAVFSKGVVEQVGTPLQIYKRPKNRFVANFIGETNFIPGKVLRVGAGEGFVETEIGNFRGALVNATHPPQVDDSVWLCIRPESLKLETTPCSENCIAGEIGNATYFGEVAHYEFEKQGVRLKISELNPCHLGQTNRKGLFASAMPEDVVILKK